MASPIYATAGDVEAHLGDTPPPGAVTAAALRNASRQVDDMLFTAVYETDDDDMPTNARVLAAIREATIEQALHVDSYGDESEIRSGGDSVTLGALALGGVKVGGGGGVTVWAPRAVSALRVAGLIPGSAR